MAEEVPREGSTSVTRRGFVGWAVGLGAGFMALVAGIPTVGMFLGSAPAQAGAFADIADVTSLPVGEPTGVTFVQETVDAYLHEQLPHSVWVTKRSDTDVVVFTPVCPHLGCQVTWDKQKKEYVCPCHNSIFTPDGKVVAGPAPRPLDTLPSKISNGRLLVQWVNYKPGLSTKEPV
jgi:quinol---cytochrome c reductase iron-sulfur subunit, bacillus type